MKKYLICLIFLLFAVPAAADSTARQMHPIYISARLANLDEFTDYIFVHLETQHGEIKVKETILPKRGVVKEDLGNQLEILAVPKQKFDAEGLDALDLLADPSILRTAGSKIESGMQLVPGPTSLSGKDVYYDISIEGGKLHLTKTGEKEFRSIPNYPPVNILIVGFVVALILEGLIFILCTRLLFRLGGPGLLRSATTILCAQGITLPILGLLLNHYATMASASVLATELGITAIEGAIYKLVGHLSWRHAMIVSFLANGLFFLAALIG